MSEALDNRNENAVDGRLAEAIREMKNAVADRDDVVVDIREAQRTRLELLAEDLAPIFAEVPKDDDRFDFVLSSGIQPRLWIDSVAHVTLGRDRRTYRFLRDTRLGRVVLAETSDMKAVADHVTRYIAERVIERRRVLEGDVATVGLASQAGPGVSDSTKSADAGNGFLRGLGIVLLGALLGIAAFAVFAWERLVELFRAI